jgi:Spy/CpxP family protein refolding chaperone
MKRTPLLAIVFACMAVVLGLAPSARAQGMGMTGQMPGQGQISRRSVDAYAKLLQLDADQKAGAVALFEGYQAGMKEVGEGSKKAMEKMQERMREEGMEPAIFKQLETDMQPLTKRAEELESGFFSDLKALLTPEQAGRFDKVDRHRRRDKQMRFALASGSRANLLEVVDAIKAPEDNKELNDALESYEMELDRVLIARESAMKGLEEDGKKIQEKAMEGMKNMDFSAIMAESIKMMKKGKELEKPLREVHKTHARRIAEHLPADKQADFQREFKLRSYPRIYRESDVSKQMKAALGFTDLTPEQKTRIEEIRASYEKDLGPLNQQWAAAVEVKEDKLIVNMPMMPSQEEDPTVEPRKARRELDKATRTKLREVLTDEQKERLPKETRNPMDDMMDMGIEIDAEAAEAWAPSGG